MTLTSTLYLVSPTHAVPLLRKEKDRYENEWDKLEKLMRKRDELRSKELMEAFARSERSFVEVMRFLSGNEVDDE